MYACRFVSYHMLSGERNQFLWFFVFVCVSVRLLLFLIASVHACRCHPCRLWFNCHRYLLHRCIDWCTCVCLFLAQRCCSTHVDYSFVVVVNQISGNKCFAVVPRNTRSFERFKYLRTCFFAVDARQRWLLGKSQSSHIHVDYFFVVVHQASGNKCFAVVPRTTGCSDLF